MEDQNQSAPQDHNSTPTQPRERNEPVRTRWTPKPEQILILESIFNSGMVNPPKEETVRIRKLLEKFGAVGDANVFYWFQNRRSRSRRRQRQMQAANLNCTTAGSAVGDHHSLQQHKIINSGTIDFNYCGGGYVDPQFLELSTNSSSCYDGCSSSCSSSAYGLDENQYGGSHSGGNHVFPFPGEMGMSEMDPNCSMGSIFANSDNENFPYQSGIITVFINGVASEVPAGPIDMKTMFGADVALVHSSGIQVPFNDFGFTLQGLHHGESYFLVSRPT